MIFAVCYIPPATRRELGALVWLSDLVLVVEQHVSTVVQILLALLRSPAAFASPLCQLKRLVEPIRSFPGINVWTFWDTPGNMTIIDCPVVELSVSLIISLTPSDRI